MSCFIHDDEQADRLFASATELLAEGNAGQAKPLLQHLLAEHSDALESWNIQEFLGECLFQLKDFEGALRELESALLGNSDSKPEGHNKLHILHYLALSNFLLGRWSGAIDWFNEAEPLLFHYDSPAYLTEALEFHLGKGRCYLHLDDNDHALTEFKRSHALLEKIPDERNPRLYVSRVCFELGRTCLRKRQLGEAWQYLEMVEESRLTPPYDRWYAQARIDYFFYRDEFLAVLHEYDRSRRFTTPDDEKAAVFYVVGVSHYHLKQFVEARRYLTDALRFPFPFDWLRQNASRYLEWIDERVK